MLTCAYLHLSLGNLRVVVLLPTSHQTVGLQVDLWGRYDRVRRSLVLSVGLYELENFGLAWRHQHLVIL